MSSESTADSLMRFDSTEHEDEYPQNEAFVQSAPQAKGKTQWPAPAPNIIHTIAVELGSATSIPTEDEALPAKFVKSLEQKLGISSQVSQAELTAQQKSTEHLKISWKPQEKPKLAKVLSPNGLSIFKRKTKKKQYFRTLCNGEFSFSDDPSQSDDKPDRQLQLLTQKSVRFMLQKENHQEGWVPMIDAASKTIQDMETLHGEFESWGKLEKPIHQFDLKSELIIDKVATKIKDYASTVLEIYSVFFFLIHLYSMVHKSLESNSKKKPETKAGGFKNLPSETDSQKKSKAQNFPPLTPDQTKDYESARNELSGLIHRILIFTKGDSWLKGIRKYIPGRLETYWNQDTLFTHAEITFEFKFQSPTAPTTSTTNAPTAASPEPVPECTASESVFSNPSDELEQLLNFESERQDTPDDYYYYGMDSERICHEDPSNLDLFDYVTRKDSFDLEALQEYY